MHVIRNEAVAVAALAVAALASSDGISNFPQKTESSPCINKAKKRQNTTSRFAIRFDKCYNQFDLVRMPCFQYLFELPF